MSQIKKVIDNLNRIALVNGEHMRLIGYEKVEGGQNSFLFSSPVGSNQRKVAQLADDHYYRYADYLYIPFIAPTRKINRHLALNGAPIVQKPVIIKSENIPHKEYLKLLSEKYSGKLIQITTEDGLVVGVLDGIREDDNEDMGLYLNGSNGKSYVVYEPILPFYIAEYNMSGDTLKGILKEI
jgi:hypothetical protein